MGLKIQIWDSSCRDLSAKRIVYTPVAEDGDSEDGGGKVAAKRQCLDGVLCGA